MIIISQAVTLTVGVAVIGWLLYLIVLVKRQKPELSQTIVGMLRAEVTAISCTLVFTINALFTESNEIDFIIATFLRLSIFIPIGYYSGQLYKQAASQHIKKQESYNKLQTVLEDVEKKRSTLKSIPPLKVRASDTQLMGPDTTASRQ